MWAQVKRVLKQRGAFVTTASQPFTSALVTSNIKWFKYEWVWRKSNLANFANVKSQPLREHENVLVFCSGVTTYNAQRVQRSDKSLSRDPKGSTRVKGGALGKIENYAGINDISHAIPADGMRNPSTILCFDSENYPQGFTHPTKKPVALYEYLIRTYTNPGETVLDFTMGSGTTGVAAIRTGRNFIGCEKDAGYFAIAQRRCAEASLQPALFQTDATIIATQEALI